MPAFTNVATLSYNGTSVNSNITTGEIQEVLSATKTAVVGDYIAGDDITYVISIINSGTTAFSGLTVTDDLGAYTATDDTAQPPTETTVYPLTYIDNSVRLYLDGVLQASPVTEAGPPLVISGLNIPGGSNAIIVYEATVNEFAPLAIGDTIDNTATLSGAGLVAEVTASETITAQNDIALTITKTLNPTVVTENGQITYTFVIQNSGNRAATIDDNIILTDTFDPALNPISVTFNGETWSAGTNYTYDAGTGAFATLPDQITVPAATYTQNADGSYTVSPGVAVLTVTGVI